MVSAGQLFVLTTSCKPFLPKHHCCSLASVIHLYIPPPAPQSMISPNRAMAIKAPTMPKPKWHPQWKLMRVIAGHLGWVRCITVDPSNQWFATGSADRALRAHPALYPPLCPPCTPSDTLLTQFRAWVMCRTSAQDYYGSDTQMM